MDKEALATTLENIALGLRAEDAGRFRVQSYEDAAEIVRSENTEQLEEAPQEIDGVGDSLGEKIEEFSETGTIEYWEELQDRHDLEFVELTDVEGLGFKTAQKIYDELGVETLDGLQEACENEAVQEISGLGAKSEENFLEGIQEVHAGAQERKPIDDVDSYWEGLSSRLRVLQRKDVVDRFEPAGSYRRREETVGDLDVIVESTQPEEVFDNLERWQVSDRILGRGDTKMSFRVDALQIDIRVVREEEYGACLQYFTGTYQHNVALRQHALDLGYTLNEYGIFEVEGRDENGDVIKGDKVGGATEEEIYEKLGLPVPDPEERTEEWVEERI